VSGPVTNRPWPGACASAGDDTAAFHAYVHLRANEYGPTKEFWYHANGCRRWLIVSRDTRDHSILGVEFAQR